MFLCKYSLGHLPTNLNEKSEVNQINIIMIYLIPMGVLLLVPSISFFKPSKNVPNDSFKSLWIV